MDNYIVELGEIINNSKKYIDKKTFKLINDYYDIGEYEVALEGMILELSKSEQYPDDFDPDLWKKIAVDFELDQETTIDTHSWDYFINWCNEYKSR